jgi:hypothetical protein
MLDAAGSTFPSTEPAYVTITAPGNARVTSIRGNQASGRIKLPETGTYTVTLDPGGATVGSANVRVLPAPIPTRVSLAATTGEDGSSTLTATTDGPADGAASIRIGVYDVATGQRVGTCDTGTVCTVRGFVPRGGGTPRYIAAVGAIPTTWTGATGNWFISNEVSASPWTVDLQTATAANGTLTLIATTNYPVNGNASYWVAIYDRTTRQRLGYCSSGRTCTLSGIRPIGGGEHALVAAVGDVPPTWSDTWDAWAVSAAVSPAAWSATLTATVEDDGALTLTSTTNYPVNGNASYWVAIYDRTTGERLGHCSSGTTCTLTRIRPSGEGRHSFVAAVGTAPATWSETGNWAVSNVVDPEAWSVSLVSATESDGALTLTSTTNYPVNGNASYWVAIYDRTTRQRLGHCSSGTTCTLTRIRPVGGGVHSFVAAVGTAPATWSETGNWDVSTDVSVPAWQVTLDVVAAADGTLTATARTNYPVNGNASYWVGIYDRTTGQRLGYCSSGRSCTVSRLTAPASGQQRTFIASAGSVPGTWTATTTDWAVSDPVSHPAA